MTPTQKQNVQIPPFINELIRLLRQIGPANKIDRERLSAEKQSGIGEIRQSPDADQPDVVE
jgi:hypothetical protein